jgi:hypothetical protein
MKRLEREGLKGLFSCVWIQKWKYFLSYILLVLTGGPTFLILRDIIYRYKMAMASGDVGDN